MTILISVDLPAPLSPKQAEHLTGSKPKADIPRQANVDTPERLADLPEPEAHPGGHVAEAWVGPAPAGTAGAGPELSVIT